MKKLFSILSVITLVLFFASCSSDSSKKTLKPESLEFTSGTLGQHFKIVDEPAELTMVKKDQTYFFRLEVKCQKTTDDFAGMDPAEINTNRFPRVGTVELLDENKIQCNRSLVLYLDPVDLQLSKGTRVRITGGVFEGVEGVFIRVRHDRRVVVCIEGITAVATTFVPPSLVEPL